MDGTYLRTIPVNETGDINLDGTLVGGVEKIAQDVSIILRNGKGSYSLDLDFGVDYVDMMENGNNREIMRSVLTRELMKHPAIESVETVTITPTKDRGTLVTTSVLLVGGETFQIGKTFLFGRTFQMGASI